MSWSEWAVLAFVWTGIGFGIGFVLYLVWGLTDGMIVLPVLFLALFGVYFLFWLWRERHNNGVTQ